MPIPCSVVILTFNEETNVAGVLSSLEDFEDVHVLDSGSADRTVQLAQAHGAQVSTNRFCSFAQQRNWAHDHAPLRFPWVLHLDADERMTPALRTDIEEAISTDDGTLGGYYLAEKTILQGKWLRHAGQFPRYQARLVHKDRMRFVDHGHGQRESSELPFKYIHSPYVHLAFSHGLHEWLQKHAAYAVREATLMAAGETRHFSHVLRDLWSPDRSLRRRALKYLGMRAPLRPALRWAHIYLFNRGFLDGRAGWKYAHMMWLFQHMIDFSLAAYRAQENAGE